ncbi:a-factor receptor [Serendipita sp. 396]|nr:a-factor receptor [Serendipita sp. 396]KAG8776839.1 a-factor receptor [Serendipita sp. 397]KAG8794382.1 a-factor receptor [Serendipita sp. 398]
MSPKNFSYMFPAYPIICIIATILALIPLTTHWLAGNIGAVALSLWIVGGNIMAAVNTIVWHGNLNNPHPVWGDICQAYFSVMNFGLSAGTLYVQYTLWKVARNRRLFVSPREKRRQKLWAVFFCYGIPLIFVVLHYIVQGHRYDLVEDLGPTPTAYPTPLTYVLYFIWDPIFCLIAIGLSIHTYSILYRHGRTMEKVFISSKKNSEKKYYRLLGMTLLISLIHFPIVLGIMLYNAIKVPTQPWISWDDTHFDFNRINYLSREIVETIPDIVTISSISYWSIALCGYTYFFFFGTGTEARRQYRVALVAVCRRFGIELPERKEKEKKKTTRSTGGKRSWLDRLLGRRREGESFLSTIGDTSTGITFVRTFQRESVSGKSGMDKVRPDETIVISPSTVSQARDGEDIKHYHSWIEVESRRERPSGEEEGIDLEAQGSSAVEQREQEQEQRSQFEEEQITAEPEQTEEITF